MMSKTFKQWHYANLGRKFQLHLSGYNAGHLADAWHYQQKRIDDLEQQLKKANEENKIMRDALEKIQYATCKTHNELSAYFADRKSNEALKQINEGE